MATRPQTLYGLADSPIDLAAFILDHRDGSGQPGLVQQVLEERLDRPSDLTPRRHPGQHHPLLADQHRGVLGEAVLGEQAPPYLGQGSEGPGRREHLRGRDLPGSAELGRAGVPQPRHLRPATTGAGTSPPGSSRSCSPKTSVRRSDRCPDDDPVRTCAHALVRRRDRVARLRATRPRRAGGHVVVVNFWRRSADLFGYAERLGLDMERFAGDLGARLGRERIAETSKARTSARSLKRRLSPPTAAATTALRHRLVLRGGSRCGGAEETHNKRVRESAGSPPRCAV